MNEAKERTIAIPYYPAPKSMEARPHGFVCPICKYKCNLKNANYCPGCGQKIKLVFTSEGDWRRLLFDVAKLPKAIREKLIIRPIEKIYGYEGPEIYGIYLSDFRERLKEFERNKSTNTPHGQIYKDLKKNQAQNEEENIEQDSPT